MFKKEEVESIEKEKDFQLNVVGNFYSFGGANSDNYKMFANLSIDLVVEDFNKLGTFWNETFINIKKDKIDKFQMTELLHDLPRIVFNKIKKDYPDIFAETKFYCFAHFLIWQKNPLDQVISCEIDCFK